MDGILELLLGNVSEIIAAVMGAAAVAIVSFVKSTGTKIDDKALESLADKVKEKLNEDA